MTGEGGAAFDHSYTMMDELRFFTQNRHLLDGEPLPKPEPGYYSTTAIADYGVRFLKEHARDLASDPFSTRRSTLRIFRCRRRRRTSTSTTTASPKAGTRPANESGSACGAWGSSTARSPLEPNMWTNWNTPDAELIAKIGPGEVSRAVPWSTLTPEQKKLQRTKMAIHAAMISRMDAEIGKLMAQVEAMGALDDTVVLFLSDNGASSEQLIRGDGHDATAPLGSARTHLGLGPGWASCSNAPFRLHNTLDFDCAAS